MPSAAEDEERWKSAFSAGQVAGPAFEGIVTALADLRLPFLLVGPTSGIAFVGSLLLPRASEKTAAIPGTQTVSGATRLFNRAAIILLIARFCLLAGYGGFITTYAPAHGVAERSV